MATSNGETLRVLTRYLEPLPRRVRLAQHAGCWLRGGLKPGADGVPRGVWLLVEQQMAGTLDDGEPGCGQCPGHFFCGAERDEPVPGSVDDRRGAGDGRQDRAEIGALHDCLLLSEKGFRAHGCGHGPPGGKEPVVGFVAWCDEAGEGGVDQSVEL